MGIRLPRVTAKEIVRVIKRKGFYLVRQSGSHQIYRNAVGIRTTVPMHSEVIIKPKTLKSILKDIKMTAKELEQEL